MPPQNHDHWKRHLWLPNAQTNTQSLIENGSPSVIEHWFGRQAAGRDRGSEAWLVTRSKMAVQIAYLLMVFTYIHS
jgi:hypothetical protein